LALHCFYKVNTLEAGCDEAEEVACRACFAASVILPFDYINIEIKDSKKISEKKRYRLRKKLKSAISCSVAQVIMM